MEEDRAPDPLTFAGFAMVVALGAGNFIAVRMSNLELPPFWGAGFRFALAACLFVGIAIVLRLPWPRGKQLMLNATYGTLGFALFYALMYWALVRVTAGVATVVMASVPLVTLLLATAQGREQLRARSVAGALLALSGIAWISLDPGQVAVPPAALAAMLVAVVCVGQSIIVGKALSANHPAMTNAVGMAVGAVLLLGLSAVAGEAWSLPREPEAIWAVTYLVVLGSVGMFVLVLMVVRRWTASATSYMFVLFPVVTILLEAWLMDEPVILRTIAGAGLVMAGVWFGALRSGERGTERPASPAPVPPPPGGP